MTQQIINIGAAPNDGTGDPLRTAMTKANDNFTELYTDKLSILGRAAVSVFGRSANTVGSGADIVAASNGHYLMRRGDVVSFAAPRASEMEFTPAGGISAVTVQAAIAEVDAEKIGITRVSNSVVGRATNSAGSAADIQATATGQVLRLNGSTLAFMRPLASDVTNSPSGGIAATDVQAAINELDTEKLSRSGGLMTGPITISDPEFITQTVDNSYVRIKGATTNDRGASFIFCGKDFGAPGWAVVDFGGFVGGLGSRFSVRNADGAGNFNEKFSVNQDGVVASNGVNVIDSGGRIFTRGYTAATLPTVGVASGTRAMVTDSSGAVSFGGGITGGGGNTYPVYNFGGGWAYG
jgi:hypothetical protein